MTWPDIDFERRILVVRGGKGGKDRLVGVSDTLLEQAEEFVKRWVASFGSRGPS